MAEILDKMAYYHMLHIMKKRPLDINIETVTMCPLKCVFCCNRLYHKEYTVMDNELFENILKQYCSMGGGAISIGAMQSDFLSDPLLMDRMKIVKKYKKKLWLYSTTPLVSCKRYSDKELTYILRLFDFLQISVEGYNKESYQNMAGINGYDIFIEQLRRVKKIIDDNSLTVKIALYFRTNDKKALMRSKLYKELSRKFDIEEVRDTFFSWFGTIKKEDIPKGARLILIYNQGKKVNCVVPNASLAVQANGKVVGCGCVDWLEKYVIGDCRKDGLKEIWKSPKSVKFRNAFQKGKLPSICQECGLYTPIDACIKDRKLLIYKPTDGLYYLVKRG